MSLNYSIAMLSNPQDKKAPAKAYAKAQTNGEMSLKNLSQEVANKCTVHQADVSAVLIATVETLFAALNTDYPDARIVGHQDLPGVQKDCPCFEVL